ncbi:MAG: hypothetical protein KF749_03070 [Bacteroidetes bacterium]|nr:hypothetical protein [Bacteroidota bacterium]MCW5896798.1 hypothetical protein [Bacteroidota bacterium]
MIIIREVFTAKPGQASKMAKLFKKAFAADSNVRVMTDMVGDYNTVVMEMQAKSLADFEKMMEEYKSGKPDPNMDPKVAEELSKYTELYLTGRREIFQIVE